MCSGTIYKSHIDLPIDYIYIAFTYILSFVVKPLGKILFYMCGNVCLIIHILDVIFIIIMTTPHVSTVSPLLPDITFLQII